MNTGDTDLTCYAEIGRGPRSDEGGYLAAIVVQEADPYRHTPLTVVHDFTSFNRTLEEIADQLYGICSKTGVKRFVLDISLGASDQILGYLRWRFKGCGFKFVSIGHAH